MPRPTKTKEQKLATLAARQRRYRIRQNLAFVIQGPPENENVLPLIAPDPSSSLLPPIEENSSIEHDHDSDSSSSNKQDKIIDWLQNVHDPNEKDPDLTDDVPQVSSSSIQPDPNSAIPSIPEQSTQSRETMEYLISNFGELTVGESEISNSSETPNIVAQPSVVSTHPSPNIVAQSVPNDASFRSPSIASPLFSAFLSESKHGSGKFRSFNSSSHLSGSSDDNDLLADFNIEDQIVDSSDPFSRDQPSENEESFDITSAQSTALLETAWATFCECGIVFHKRCFEFD